MNVNEIYPNKSATLKAADLNGKAVKVVVSGADVAEFDNGNKLVLKFKDKEKGLVLNKTNANIIASHFGPDSDGWTGKEIIVYPDKTTFGGEIVDCLRVRVEAEMADPNDDIPF